MFGGIDLRPIEQQLSLPFEAPFVSELDQGGESPLIETLFGQVQHQFVIAQG